MDSTEEFNYIPNYQQLLFQESANESETADVKRKCMVQTYTSALNLLNNENALNVLKIKLDDYSKYVDQNKNVFNNFKTDTKGILNETNLFSSSLSNVDINEFLKPLPCTNKGNNVFCQNSNISEESLQEFMNLFNQNPIIKQDINNEPKVRKIAKSFAPRCIPRESKLFKTSSADSLEDKLIKTVESVKETEQNTTPSTSCFKTAREELQLQNQKKFGVRSVSQNQLNNVASGVGQKRKLGTRRNFQNKFISPMLSNNLSDDEAISKNDEWSSDQVVDARLKNIEPRMVELIRSEIMDVGATVVWDDIAGLEFAKTAIQEAVVWPLLRPDIFTGLRRPPKGILLFGPPGTGKTLIGKCVASQSKSTFFSISASSLTSKWIGDGEKMVRALFAVARCHQPAVIFIDEIDSLLSQRSETEHESSRRIKTEFLVQLDGATTDNEERILVIGATNRPQELDEAARRRFVKRLYIPLPEFEARLHLVMRLMASEKHVLNHEHLQEIAKLSEGYSGADMKNLCSEASLGPIRSIDMSMIHCIQSGEVRPVNMDDFNKAFSRVKASVSPNDLDQYLKWNKTFGSGSSF